jgi:hypothetical protein
MWKGMLKMTFQFPDDPQRRSILRSMVLHIAASKMKIDVINALII